MLFVASAQSEAATTGTYFASGCGKPVLNTCRLETGWLDVSWCLLLIDKPLS